MKEKGKAVETNIIDLNFYSSSSSDLPCKRHPSPSSVGICAHCLKERLIKLVCSDCGEQRLSSCSCSEVSSYRNSSATDVGSVGRISFLIENERIETKQSQSKPKNGAMKSEDVVVLKRSSSSCVGVKRSGIWRIVRLFRRKRREKDSCCERRSVEENKSEMWVLDYMGGVGGVGRSRSLCSFRGGSFHEEISSDFAFSSAKISDFNGNSVVESERISGFSEPEPRKRSVFPVKESDFSEMDESGFIDLKLDLETESKTEYTVLRGGDLAAPVAEFGGFGSFRRGGSCRITVNEREVKREKRGHRGWRWIFRQYPNWRSGSKKDEIHVLRA